MVANIAGFHSLTFTIWQVEDICAQPSVEIIVIDTHSYGIYINNRSTLCTLFSVAACVAIFRFMSVMV